MQVLESLIHRNEPYLLLLHKPFCELQAVGTLCNIPESLKIFFLSDAPNPVEGLTLLQMGAVGYANTYIAGGRLAEAVKTVHAGRVWFEQDIISRLIGQLKRRSPSGDNGEVHVQANLTEREKEIALLITEGMSNQDIGNKLYISERTVKAHLGSIFRKTGAKSRLHLAMKIRQA